MRGSERTRRTTYGTLAKIKVKGGMRGAAEICSTSIWFHIPRSVFQKMGGLEFLLKCDFDVHKVPVKLSNFHKQILQFWKMIFTHNFSPHGSILWNNRVITINRKSIFRRDWYEKGILFVKDVMDSDGRLLDYRAWLEKYDLNCTQREYNKICKAIPLPLIQLIQNVLLYLNVELVLPKLMINDCYLSDKKCNNKLISVALKSIIFHDYNRGITAQVSDKVTVSMMEKAHSKYIKWPISPKIKETHFKIFHKVYPVAEFLKNRFKFEVDLCTFCNSADETLEHMFFSCPVSRSFWLEIKNWLSLKISYVPVFEFSHILLYADNLKSNISDMINIIILMGKYHIHCTKWRNSKPSFLWFIHDFKLFFLSLKKLHSSKRKICRDISEFLLF